MQAKLIKADKLKKTDRWKFLLSDRDWNIVTDIINLDETKVHSLCGKLVICEGQKQIVLNKNDLVFQVEFIEFSDFIRNHIDFS